MTDAERILEATWLHDYLTTDPPEVPSLEDIAEETGDEELLDDRDAAALRDLAAQAETEETDEDEAEAALRFPDGSRLLVMMTGADEHTLAMPDGSS